MHPPQVATTVEAYVALCSGMVSYFSGFIRKQHTETLSCACTELKGGPKFQIPLLFCQCSWLRFCIEHNIFASEYNQYSDRLDGNRTFVDVGASTKGVLTGTEISNGLSVICVCASARVCL